MPCPNNTFIDFNFCVYQTIAITPHMFLHEAGSKFFLKIIFNSAEKVPDED